MPNACKRQRSSSPASAASCRSADEWEKLEGGSVLLLPPTSQHIRHVAHVSSVNGAPPIVKIAAFDMDDTVVKPASGGVFAKDDPADWQWLHPHVRGHLQHLHACGFLVVLFSNQMGIGKGSAWNTAKAEAIQEKVVQLSRDAAVPLCACVATRDDCWRKPSPRIWQLLEARVAQCLTAAMPREGHADGEAVVDCEAYSFYVGDAAGRATPTLAGRKKDFSCSDRQFAYNLQLPFFTPEQFFAESSDALLQEDTAARRVTDEEDGTGLPQPSFRLSTTLLRKTAPAASASPANDFSWGDVSPEELQGLPKSYAQLSVQVISPTAVTTTVLPAAPPFFARLGQQEMIIFVGFPGCGKSSLFRRHFEPYGYVSVNRDTLQTKAKCLKAAAGHWAAGRSVVVDNTSPTAEDRQAYIDLVKKCGTKNKKDAKSETATDALLPVRIFFFTHSRGLGNHMNTVRALVEGAHRVPAIAYNVFNSRLQRPAAPEEVAALGIEAVWEIPPVACFDDAHAAMEKAFYLLT